MNCLNELPVLIGDSIFQDVPFECVIEILFEEIAVESWWVESIEIGVIDMMIKNMENFDCGDIYMLMKQYLRM